MQVTPVRSKRQPQYPTHEILALHPELLALVPERWRMNPLVLRVLAGVVSLSFSAEMANAQKQKTVASHVAPLFMHGDGRGAFGCQAINPPVFLSEEEAKQVIREEAQKAGLSFEASGYQLKNATVPLTHQFWCSEEDENSTKPKTQQMDLKLTGFDKNHQVAFEYVSTDEIEAWTPKNQGCVSSVSSYDLLGAAKTLANGLQHQAGTPWIGIFYEPAAASYGRVHLSKNATDAEYKKAYDAEAKKAKAIDAEELRKQVRDFVGWLKAQGVI
jgi:hypothetical protein